MIPPVPLNISGVGWRRNLAGSIKHYRGMPGAEVKFRSTPRARCGHPGKFFLVRVGAFSG
jgi:hypothetical protein